MLTRRFDPFVGALRLHGDFFGPSFLQKMERASSVDYHPAVDILETENALVFRADLPGVKKEDLKIELEKDVLTLSGSRSRTETVEGENQWRNESHVGSFSRGFRLPKTVDASTIQAKLEDGILAISIGLKEEEKPVTVEID